MKCPFCGREMQQGKLRTRGRSYFIPEGCKPPLLDTEERMGRAGAIMVSPHPLSDAYEADGQAAFLCEQCRKVVMEY